MGVGTTPPKSNFLYVNLIKNVGCEKNWDGRGNSPEIFFSGIPVEIFYMHVLI